MENLNERLIQAKLDRDKVNENIEELKEKIELQKNPGIEGWELIPETEDCLKDFLRKNHYVRGHKVSIIEYKGKILLVVPLPSANTDWTFEAFDYVKKAVICGSSGVYPVHGCFVPDKKDLYIHIGYNKKG